MNKTKLILAVIGGVIALATLVMAYLIWSSFSAKTAALEGDEEGGDGLETVVSKAQTLSHKPIYPCAASVTAVNSNAAVLAAWKDESVKLASRGDKVFEKTTPAAFKTFIVADAKRLAALPGAVNGAIVKPTFDFGPFKDYITGGKLPADDQLAELQRKWDDVVTVVETLGQGGIAELTGVEFKTEEAKQEQSAKDDRKNRRQANARNNRNARSAETSAAIEPVKFSYVFTFTTRAPGFIKTLNQLSTCERFVVIDDFTFNRGADTLAEALGGDEKKSAQQASGRSRRRGRGRAAEEVKDEKGDDKRKGIVTDPVLDAPFSVSMTVSVYDFRSLEDNEKPEEVAK